MVDQGPSPTMSKITISVVSFQVLALFGGHTKTPILLLLCLSHFLYGWATNDLKMAICLNSVSSFNSTLQTNLQNVSKTYTGASGLKTKYVEASSGLWFGSRKSSKYNRQAPLLLSGDSNRITTDQDSRNAESAFTDDQLISSAKDEQGPQTPEASNGLVVPLDLKPDTLSSLKAAKRSSLTAREKLRAARVLSRYTESKPPKSEMGSNVLDALRESDRGKKRSGLPEAPTNLLDDSKRGMPKKGLTFDFPGGVDLFIIVTSVVFISTVMFATTYIVWKAGAIHFNE